MPSRVAYIKTSLIDFPGRLAAVLFMPGCDFRCPYCHNAALVELPIAEGAAGLVPMGEFLEFLDRRKSLISGVVISGGEPLLHEDAPRIARAIRYRNLAVKLDTNGSHPERIADVGADYVALDIKTAPAAYGLVSPRDHGAGGRAFESLAYLRSSGTPFEIRITCVPGVVGEAELEAILPYLERDDEIFLQAFRPGGCLDPRYDEIQPYAQARMTELLSIVSRAAPRVRIRGS